MNYQSIISKAIKTSSGAKDTISLGSGSKNPSNNNLETNDPHAAEYKGSINQYASPINLLPTSYQSELALQNLIKMNILRSQTSMNQWSNQPTTQKNPTSGVKIKPANNSEDSGSMSYESSHGWFNESGDYLSQGILGAKSHVLPTEFQGRIDQSTWEGVNKHLYNMFNEPKALGDKVLEYQDKAGSLASDPWILSTMIAKGATDKEIKSGIFNFMANDDNIAYRNQGRNTDAMEELITRHTLSSSAVNSTLANKYGIQDTYATSGRLLVGTYQSDQIIDNLPQWMEKFREDNSPDAKPKLSITFYLINDSSADHNGVFTSSVRGKEEGQLTQLIVNRGNFSADRPNDLVFAIQGSQALLEQRSAEVAQALHKQGITDYKVNFIIAGHGSGQDIQLGGRFGGDDGSLGYQDLTSMRKIGQHFNGASHIGIMGASCYSGEGLVQSFGNAVRAGVKDMGGNTSVHTSGPQGEGWFNTNYNADNGFTVYLPDGSGARVVRSVAGNNVDGVIPKDKESTTSKKDTTN